MIFFLYLLFSPFVTTSRARFSCFSRSFASAFSSFFCETVVDSLNGLISVRSLRLNKADDTSSYVEPEK